MSDALPAVPEPDWANAQLVAAETAVTAGIGAAIWTVWTHAGELRTAGVLQPEEGTPNSAHASLAPCWCASCGHGSSMPNRNDPRVRAQQRAVLDELEQLALDRLQEDMQQ